MIKRIGIIGQGFVGSAITRGMEHVFEVLAYDKKDYEVVMRYTKDGPGCSTHDDPVKYLINEVDGPVFLCLPTPMNPNGSCNTDIVESVVDRVNIIAKELDKFPILIIKSTVPPGTTDRLNAKYTHVEVCFNPEFLTERTAVDDFKNQEFIIVGGCSDPVSVVKHMYQRAYPNVPCYKTEARVAEMVKYTINAYLAIRVSYANEIKLLCDRSGIDYDKVVEYATKDKRIGHTHWAVPGPDGRCGFGGSCFPKDINALLTMAMEKFVFMHTLEGAWETNLTARPEQDWKKLIGRAVVEEVTPSS